MAIKLLELFGGIGACSKAFERCGIPYEIADYVEIDKHAVNSYNAIHGTNFEPQDIRNWDKNIKVDVIMHGSPCQDFSIAGTQNGGDAGSGTRSSLMYETIRIVKKLKPKYVIWENVKNLLGKQHKHNFDKYINELNELGYVSSYKVLNAKNYGIPQNRERVFTISVLGGPGFTFSDGGECDMCIHDFMVPDVDTRYYMTPERMKKEEARRERNLKRGNGFGYKYMDPGGVSNTIVTSPDKSSGLYVFDFGLRKFTPLECWRLMGFDDDDYTKAAAVNSENQLYKQAGNSIVVNVLEAILIELFKED